MEAAIYSILFIKLLRDLKYCDVTKKSSVTFYHDTLIIPKKFTFVFYKIVKISDSYDIYFPYFIIIIK